MRTRIAAAAIGLAALAGCASSAPHNSSHGRPATAKPSASASAPRTAATAAARSACKGINLALDEIVSDANSVTPPAGAKVSKQDMVGAQLAKDLSDSAQDFSAQESAPGITVGLKSAEQLLQMASLGYYSHFGSAGATPYGNQLVSSLNSIKKICGPAPWQG